MVSKAEVKAARKVVQQAWEWLDQSDEDGWPIRDGDEFHGAVTAYRQVRRNKALPPEISGPWIEAVKLSRLADFDAGVKARQLIEERFVGWFNATYGREPNGGEVPPHVRESDACSKLRSPIKKRILNTIATLIYDGFTRPTGQQVADAMPPMTCENARQHLAALVGRGLLDNEGNGYFFPPPRPR